MNKYEVRHVNDKSGGYAFILERLTIEQRRDFPWVIWGPAPGFALGEVKALFTRPDEAEQFCKVANALTAQGLKLVDI